MKEYIYTTIYTLLSICILIAFYNTFGHIPAAFTFSIMTLFGYIPYNMANA
jgi:hypothetical protein